jgi:hypothetical protein
MARQRSVEYIVDENGRRKAVVLSYKAYRELLEDLADLTVKAQREHEKPLDFEEVLAELRNAGRL